MEKVRVGIKKRDVVPRSKLAPASTYRGEKHRSIASPRVRTSGYNLRAMQLAIRVVATTRFIEHDRSINASDI